MAERSLAQRDTEFWSARVRALATLAAADAVAVLLPVADGRYVSFAAHNLPDGSGWLEGAAQDLVRSAVSQRTVQQRAEMSLRLADGRTARSMMAAPIRWADRLVGAFIALREAPVYDTTAGAPLAGLTELAGLELAVSNVLQRTGERPDDGEVRRARDDRRHAIALYELSRLALGAGGPASAADILADALDYGLVGVWLEEDGWLRLAEGHGYRGDLPRVRIDVDEALVKVVREGVSQRVQRGTDQGSWWMGEAPEVVASPFTQGPLRGMLVLGQPARPFTPADLAIAPTLAEIVGLARTPRTLAGPAPEQALAALAAATPPRAPDLPGAAHLSPPSADDDPPTGGASAGPSPAVTAPTDLPAPVRARRGWVLPLFLLALLAAAAAAFLAEPLIFVLAGMLLLVALWGWLA